MKRDNEDLHGLVKQARSTIREISTDHDALLTERHQIAKALGLENDASVDEMLAAIARLKG